MLTEAIMANSELITQLFIYFIQAAAVVAIYYAKRAYDRWTKYIDTNTTKEQQEILRVATESILLFVDKAFDELNFDDKIDEIIMRVDKRLEALGMDIDFEVIKDAVLGVWYEQKQQEEELELMRAYLRKDQ